MSKSSHFWMYLKAQAEAAPGRMIALGVLGAVLLVVVSIQVLGGPSSAGAATSEASSLVALPMLGTGSPAVGTGLPASGVRPAVPPLPDELVRDLFALLPSEEPAVVLPGVGLTGAALLQANPLPLSDDKTLEPTELRLEATYESTGSPPFLLAVIGGRVVRVGDRAGDWEVESIRPREVTIRSGGRVIVLKMP